MKARLLAGALAGVLGATACSQGEGPLESSPQGLRVASPASTSPDLAASRATDVSAEAAAAVDVQDFSFLPDPVVVRQGESVTWSFHGPRTHTASDKTGLGLFHSDSRDAGQSYAFDFQAAGKYQYRCRLHSTMVGQVLVPIKVFPKIGAVDDGYTVKWAAAAPSPGFVSDVQILRPAGAGYVDWRTGQTALKATFVPDEGPGVYSFRARLRSTANGEASSYSPVRKLTAS